MTSPITILDTTLRDGEQSEGISFTVRDKLRITQLLDELGVHFIEGGWPGSNPKAIEYFQAVKKLSLKNAKIAAFSSTRRAKNKVEDDPTIQTLLSVETPVVVVFGKTWDFHVSHALKISLQENLDLIFDSVEYLKRQGREVIFDAEHFFDGYKKNQEYAIQAIQAAQSAGASILCLCDTNGGSLPSEVSKIVNIVKEKCEKITIGIHSHNDGGLAVANAIAAVEQGATHIQGTLNGFGERCGNMNLMTMIPTLVLKMGYACVSTDQLKQLTQISHHVDEIANVVHNPFSPYIGRSAFTHKAGVHVSAILKNPETYEHTSPEFTGNQQRVVVSELSGVSNLIYKAKSFGIDIENPNSPEMAMLVQRLKELEHYGYQFEEAEASFEILMLKTLKKFNSVINLERFRVLNEKSSDNHYNIEATLKAKIKNKLVHIAAEGNGPVSALDHALRQALEKEFPYLNSVQLTDYKVRVLNSKDGTSSVVRVLIQWQDNDKEWGTVGVSENIIEASWYALVDSYEYIIQKK